MASVVAGSLFNAVAFVGAAFLFSHLNEALEKLAKEKVAWYEHTVEKANRIKELHQHRGAGATGAAGAPAPAALIVRRHAGATGCPFS